MASPLTEQQRLLVEDVYELLADSNMDRQVIRDVLIANQWEMDSAIDELMAMTSDAQVRQSMARSALQGGFITPSIAASLQQYPLQPYPQYLPQPSHPSQPHDHRQALFPPGGSSARGIPVVKVEYSPVESIKDVQVMLPGEDPLQFLMKMAANANKPDWPLPPVPPPSSSPSPPTPPSSRPTAAAAPAIDPRLVEARVRENVTLERARLRMEEEVRASEAERQKRRHEEELRQLKSERETLEQRRRQQELSLEEERRNHESQMALQRQELEIQRQKAESERAESSRKLEQMQAQLERQRRELEAQFLHLKSSPSEPDTDSGGGVSAASPGSSSDVAPAASPALSVFPLPVQEAHQVSMPPVGIYYTDSATAEELEDISFIEGLFKANGVPQEHITVCDISRDRELTAWLSQRSSGRLTSPMVFVREAAIGDLKDVTALFSENRFDALYCAVPSSSPGGDPEATAADQEAQSVGVFGNVLNAGEAVKSFFWYPVSMITSAFRDAPPEPEKGIDFEVVHQNWYWRNLKRIFRFTSTGVLRIHPTHGDVRASHPYETIDYVAAIDNWNIVLYYKDGSSPDYIRASSKLVHRMKVLLNERSNGQIRIASP